jgi:hypothetical protein
MLEKKRVRREVNRTHRKKGDGGLKLDERMLLEGSDSFKER